MTKHNSSVDNKDFVHVSPTCYTLASYPGSCEWAGKNYAHVPPVMMIAW